MDSEFPAHAKGRYSGTVHVMGEGSKEVLIILLSDTQGCGIVTSLTSIAVVPAQA